MNDTIAAISTPAGEGGIGIVRISGPEAMDVLGRVFPRALKGLEPRKMTYGHIVDSDSGTVIDEVLACFLPGPGTYTAEDTAEIYCHGGPVPLRRTLGLILRKGARLAERGEFTERAFLNGRLDLAQAEAVMDLISARTDRSFDAAMDQLDGLVSDAVKGLRAKLVDLLVDITVNIDYPEEDIEILTYDKLIKGMDELVRDSDALLLKSETGRIIRNGLKVAIVGKPNVGKSSLMNRLLRQSRAIVTEIPGTTRDTIEETLDIRGIPIVLTDTAGIRETTDTVESIGIERSKQAITGADLVVFVIDSASPLSDEDLEIKEALDPAKTIVILNKSDKGTYITKSDAAGLLPGAFVIVTSMESGLGLNELENEIYERVTSGSAEISDVPMITNVRHKDLLERSRKDIKKAKEAAEAWEPLEIVALDLEDAYEALGEIIGEAVTDDILQEVFSRFCLGK